MEVTSSNTGTGFTNGLFCTGKVYRMQITRATITDPLTPENKFTHRISFVTTQTDELYTLFGTYPLAGYAVIVDGKEIADASVSVPSSQTFMAVVDNNDVDDMPVCRIPNTYPVASATALTASYIEFHSPDYFSNIKANTAAVIKVWDIENPSSMSAGIDVTLAAGEEYYGAVVYVEITSGTITLSTQFKNSRKIREESPLPGEDGFSLLG